MSNPNRPSWDYSGFSDVHWRPVNRTRTTSTDSGSDIATSIPESPGATSSGRRFSITNMLFGSPGINRQSSVEFNNPPNLADSTQRKPSIAESVEKMIKVQRKMLDDMP